MLQGYGDHPTFSSLVEPIGDTHLHHHLVTVGVRFDKRLKKAGAMP